MAADVTFYLVRLRADAFQFSARLYNQLLRHFNHTALIDKIPSISNSRPHRSPTCCYRNAPPVVDSGSTHLSLAVVYFALYLTDNVMCANHRIFVYHIRRTGYPIHLRHQYFHCMKVVLFIACSVVSFVVGFTYLLSRACR